MVREALGDLVVRHEALRTTYAWDLSGAPVQTVRHPVPVDLTVCGEADPACESVEEDIATRDFDTARDLSLRVHARLRDGKAVRLLLSFQHIASDIATVRIVREELAELLAARAGRRTPQMEPVGAQPLDIGLREARGASCSEHVAYWLREFGRMPDRNSVVRTPRGTPFYAVRFSSSLAATRLANLARRTSTTPTAVFAAALLALLSVHFSRERLVCHLQYSGRGLEGAARTVGSLHRTCFMAVDVPAGATFPTLCRSTCSRMIDSYVHSGCNPTDIDDAQARVEGLRGVALRHGISLNLSPGEAGTRPAPAAVERLIPEEMDWDGDYGGGVDADFKGVIGTDHVSLWVGVSEAVFPGRSMVSILRTLNAVLLDLTERIDLTAGEFAVLPASVESRPHVPMADHCWIDAEAVRGVLLSCEGVRTLGSS